MAVSNAAFRNLALGTGYVSEAGRFGWSFEFWAQVPESVGQTKGVAQALRWRRVQGQTGLRRTAPTTRRPASPITRW
jgi:sulfatase modifying factor 1